MDELFSVAPVRPSAQRGVRTLPMRRAAPNDIWPPLDRDPYDVAVVASRLLSATGRIQSRLLAIARANGVDAHVFRLLLLFTESDRPVRIGNIADLLAVSHATASRTAKRAQAAGLVDKFLCVTDRREVSVRLSVPGRAAVTRCLEALRPEAAEVLGVGWGVRSHPRGQDLTGLVGPAPYLRRSSENTGWRFGVRAGMAADE